MFQLGKRAEKHREMSPSSEHNIPVVHPPYLPHISFLLPKEKRELEERFDYKFNHWKHE
jgi:hypothetical protein